jgi:hypothetical protein
MFVGEANTNVPVTVGPLDHGFVPVVNVDNTVSFDAFTIAGVR